MKWFWKSKKELFLKHELLVLNAVQGALSSELQKVFQQHVSSVNLVQRHGKGREVNMYRKDRGRITFPQERISEPDSEAVVGTAILGSPNVGPMPVGKVWAVNGHIFQIMFNANLERLRSCDHVVSVEIGPSFSSSAADVDSPAIELIPGLKVSSSGHPLSPERISSAISFVPVSLPDDFVELASRTDGFSYSNWKVLGLEDVYETPGSPGSYVLAEFRSDSEDHPDMALVSKEKQLLTVRMDDLSETPCPEGGLLAALLTAQLDQTA